MTTAPPASSASRRLLVGVVLGGTLLVSTGAAWESFFAFRGMAIMFGWPVTHAWVIMPLVEIFMLVGLGEAALRMIDDPTDPARGPKALAYSALVATLAVNIGYHVLKLAETTAFTAHWWQLFAVGSFGALIPTAQLLALHTLIGRLRRLAATRDAGHTAERRPGLLALAKARATQTLIARLTPAEDAPTARADAPPDVPGTRADTAAGDDVPGEGTRANTADPGEGTRATARPDQPEGTRATAPRNTSSARLAAAYRLYVTHVEREGTEPDGARCAGWMRVQNAATGRKARSDWRAQYARELAEGTRAYPAQLPGEVVALLPPEARARVPHGTPPNNVTHLPIGERSA